MNFLKFINFLFIGLICVSVLESYGAAAALPHEREEDERFVFQEIKRIYDSWEAFYEDSQDRMIYIEDQLNHRSQDQLSPDVRNIVQGTIDRDPDLGYAAHASNVLKWAEGVRRTAHTNIKNILDLKKHVSECERTGDITLFLSIVLDAYGAAIKKRSEIAHTLVWTLPGYLNTPPFEVNKEAAEKCKIRFAEEALIIKLSASCVPKERVRQVFHDYVSPPSCKLFRGHLTVLEAYAQGLVEHPPLPDQFQYQALDPKIAELEEESIVVLLRGNPAIKELVAHLSCCKGARPFIHVLKDPEEYAYQALELFYTYNVNIKSMLDPEIHALVGPIAGEVLDDLLKERSAQEKKRQKKKRQKAKKATAKKTQENVTASEELSDAPPNNVVLEVVPLEPVDQEEGNASEEDNDWARLKAQLQEEWAELRLKKQDAERDNNAAPPPAAQAKEPHAIALKSDLYQIMHHFWTERTMDWDDFSRLFTKFGFSIKPLGGSIRKFERGGVSFIVHEPHDSYFNHQLGARTLGIVRRHLSERLGWSLDHFESL